MYLLNKKICCGQLLSCWEVLARGRGELSWGMSTALPLSCRRSSLALHHSACWTCLQRVSNALVTPEDGHMKRHNEIVGYWRYVQKVYSHFKSFWQIYLGACWNAHPILYVLHIRTVHTELKMTNNIIVTKMLHSFCFFYQQWHSQLNDITGCTKSSLCSCLFGCVDRDYQ